MERTTDSTRAAQVVRTGGVVAYPTESVFGLGCDPSNEAAVRRILAIKRRPEEKGLILIAANLEQLTPFLAPLTAELLARVEPTWPGPVTWTLPARPETPRWLRGEHDTLAVRVTAHALTRALCEAADMALVSTSANYAGHEPARDGDSVVRELGDAVDLLLDGPTDGRAQPTEIRDGKDGTILRPA